MARRGGQGGVGQVTVRRGLVRQGLVRRFRHGQARYGTAGHGGSGTVRRGVASLGPVWSGRACWGKAVAVGRVMVRSGKYVKAGRSRYGPFRLVTVRRLRRV